MGVLAACALMIGGLLTLIPGVPPTIVVVGLLGFAVGLVLVLVLSFRQARLARVSVARAFGRAMKDGLRAVWQFAP
jgi:hypothetical protein